MIPVIVSVHTTAHIGAAVLTLRPLQMFIVLTSVVVHGISAPLIFGKLLVGLCFEFLIRWSADAISLMMMKSAVNCWA